MSGYFSSKLVKSNFILPFNNLEVIAGHYKMMVLLLVTNRAVTLVYANFFFGLEFKSDCTAMTASLQ